MLVLRIILGTYYLDGRSCNVLFLLIRGGSRTAATSKMEHFVIIVDGF